MYIYFFIINRDLRLGDLERLGELGGAWRKYKKKISKID